jgi:hypothetical protein
VLIQWCLKGVRQTNLFNINEANAALASEGLLSSWVRGATGTGASNFPSASAPHLSQAKLDAHVNNFGVAASATAYLSLSAGCRERDPTRSFAVTYPAWKTAQAFATNWGQGKGFVFCLWLLVAPKPAPELPGFGEEVRSLLASPQFVTYHHEGEIAAKLYVPAKQISGWVLYDEDLNVIGSNQNVDFVSPDRISNVIGFV